MQLTQGVTRSSLLLDLQGKLQKWSEFDPVVYELKIGLRAGDNRDTKKTEFGYIKIGHDGTKILINNQPIFLRGNLDCVHFPLTGYPSTQVEAWKKIFRIYKDYGLNHARFHSWCPPEAAFQAANRIGIYLQPEASVWIDWWMTEDMVARGRPEMDTKGHPQGLGYVPARDSFIIAEMHRMIEHYGNHPSFTMFCIGNELGNSDFEVIKKWVADLKDKDPRRLYAVSTARTITDVDDYSATHYIKDIGRTRGLNGPHSDWDFEAVYGQMQIPIIAHEIGQWPVYPSWTEIDKYSGVLKARNFQEFKASAEKNGIMNQDEDFRKASGALNQIMYKYETESFLRTPSCAGVQLLSMQDYQGQGEALIGWLDAHWETKNITTPELFRQHFSSTVPLLRIGKFVWENTETLTARVQLSHHGEQDIQEKVKYTILNEGNRPLLHGAFEPRMFAAGTLTDLGGIDFPLNNLTHAEKLTIEVSVDGTPHKNSWDVWVYPATLPDFDSGIIFTTQLDDQAFLVLENGMNVLLDASSLGDEETSVKTEFYPLYWSLTFFPGQGKTNIGLLIDPDHKAFHYFPTKLHSDWQWETISHNAKGFILNDLPRNYKPIVQPVDDFHRNNKVGSIFELQYGKGKLLVCGYNLKDPSLPVSRQLLYSLRKYMSSDAFTPTQRVGKAWLKDRLIKLELASSVDIPPAFSNAVLYIKAVEKLKDKNISVPWDPSHDSIIIGDLTQYTILNDGAWRDDHGAAWHGKDMTLTIICEAGILGDLYVFFEDWDQRGRSGTLTFEGRKSKLGNHSKDGKWIKLHVMREDSNDGKLVFRCRATNGPNLMISQVALLKE